MRYTGMATGGGGFNAYSAGSKNYGMGRGAPTMGPVDPIGYKERDAKERMRRNAMLKRLRAGFDKNYGSPAWLRNISGNGYNGGA
jgi:hypothetical protein